MKRFNKNPFNTKNIRKHINQQSVIFNKINRKMIIASYYRNLFFALFLVLFSCFETECILSEKDRYSKNHEISSENAENLCDKIYVISLDRTPERYEYVKNQLDKFNLKHEKFSAVDGKLITVTDMERNQNVPWQQVKPPHGYYRGANLKISYHSFYKDAEFFYITDRCLLNFGELGCAMSHRAIWADTVKHKYKKVIILEDDVTLDDDFRNKLSLIVNNLPNDFDVFFLDIALRYFPDNFCFIEPNFLLGKFSNTSSPYFARIKSNCKGITSSHAYVITYDSAKKLLKNSEHIHVPIDISIMSSELKLYISKIKLLTGSLNNSVIWGQKEKTEQ